MGFLFELYETVLVILYLLLIGFILKCATDDK